MAVVPHLPSPSSSVALHNFLRVLGSFPLVLKAHPPGVCYQIPSAAAPCALQVLQGWLWRLCRRSESSWPFPGARLVGREVVPLLPMYPNRDNFSPCEYRFSALQESCSDDTHIARCNLPQRVCPKQLGASTSHLLQAVHPCCRVGTSVVPAVSPDLGQALLRVQEHGEQLPGDTPPHTHTSPWHRLPCRAAEKSTVQHSSALHRLLILGSEGPQQPLLHTSSENKSMA